MLIFFKPIIDRLLVDKECFGDGGDRPTSAKKNDAFDAIGESSVTLLSVFCFESVYLFVSRKFSMNDTGLGLRRGV